MGEWMKNLDREVVCVVNMQADLRPINMNIVSMGVLDQSMVHPREIFKSAILSNAHSMLMMHNHPSGSLEPSVEDIRITDRMEQVGMILGIPLADHLIVGRGMEYYSFREKEILKMKEPVYAQNLDAINLQTDAPRKFGNILFKQMKQYKEAYPNYIYALTMGLGKTILMATCIFYEFLLANKYPRDKRFCHNALVFAPDKTVLQSLREIITFDKNKVVPPEYARVLDANIKFHFLEETGTTLHTIDDSDFNIIISNTQKIIVKKKRKDPKPVDVLFDNGSLLSSLYGDMADNSDEAWDDASLMYNQRFKKLCRLPQLGVYVDEAHHLFGADLEKQIRAKKNDRTSLRATINMLAERTSLL